MQAKTFWRNHNVGLDWDYWQNLVAMHADGVTLLNHSEHIMWHKRSFKQKHNRRHRPKEKTITVAQTRQRNKNRSWFSSVSAKCNVEYANDETVFLFVYVVYSVSVWMSLPLGTHEWFGTWVRILWILINQMFTGVVMLRGSEDEL